MTRDTEAPRRLDASFRDPSGFLYERDGVLLRQVNTVAADDYDRLLGSGLYEALVAEGLLVAHEEVDPSLAATRHAHRVLRPERMDFIAHPYEWCPGQRRDAALLTLDIQRIALDHGMTLRDASAFNVAFRAGRPIFIDTLSFGAYTEGEPWVAYRQYCQHFLAPLALETHVDVRLGELLTTNIDGIPLDLAAELLPWRTKLRPGLLTHVHAQAGASRTRQADPGQRRRTARFSERATRGLVEQLRNAVSKLNWEPDDTVWAGYYDEASHYSDAAMNTKAEVVSRWARELAPERAWDLGANTGRFSDLVADTGAHVVAWDVDHGAVERAWRERRGEAREAGEVLPLVLDLTTPTPAVGWAHRERASLADRGPVDLVLALALVHHLAIGNNVPLARVAGFLAEIAEHAIVEWVPKSDPKVQVLLATREDVFDAYTQAGFEAGFGTVFDVVDRAPVGDSGRELYLLRRNRGR